MNGARKLRHASWQCCSWCSGLASLALKLVPLAQTWLALALALALLPQAWLDLTGWRGWRCGNLQQRISSPAYTQERKILDGEKPDSRL